MQMAEDFAVRVFHYCNELDSKNQFLMSKQLFRSGTSIGANIAEAQNAESLPDFVHKFKIAAKEIDESAYWLRICKRVNLMQSESTLHSDLMNVNKVVSKILSTSKKKMIQVKKGNLSN